MKDAQGLDVNIGDRVVCKHGGKFLLGHVVSIKEKNWGTDNEKVVYIAKIALEKPFVREKWTWEGFGTSHTKTEITVTHKTVSQYDQDFPVVVRCPEIKS